MTRHLRRTALLVASIVLAATPSLAQRVAPVNATVLVRLTGHIRVLRGEDQRAWRERLLNLQEVEIGTGSGFIISPEGWVVTNHHVITGEKTLVVVQGQKLEVTVEVSAIEVLLPGRGNTPSRRLAATVYATDPELDLAILRVAAPDLPYAAIGDSDAVAAGDALTAVGYPYGGVLDLDAPKATDAVPSPSIAPGALSATRIDAEGDPRYLQVSTPLHPGNSGGPIVDSEGYVVGVAQLRLRNAKDIGFAVPINRVKQLLQKHGVEPALPVTLLAPGAQLSSTEKGLTVPVPLGFIDRSASRLRIDAISTAQTSRVADPAEESLSLRVDRVLTHHTVQQLERAVLTDGAFDRFTQTGGSPQLQARAASTSRGAIGQATGTDPVSRRPLKIVYAVLDLGKEKIVARYLGAADTIAANLSLLHASLRRMQATPLLTRETARPLPVRWAEGRHALAVNALLPVPHEWITESGFPWLCAAALGAPSAGVTMSPTGDFSVSFRAAWFPGPLTDATAGSRTCGATGAFGDASYTTRATVWGIAYRLDGVVVPDPRSGFWQLEMIAPAPKVPLVSQLFASWVQTITQ